MAFYAEERGFNGKWRPVRYDHKVAEVQAKNGKRGRRCVTEIPADHAHLTLGQLFECYSRDGRFQAMNREAG